jgi:hypothetical protein
MNSTRIAPQLWGAVIGFPFGLSLSFLISENLLVQSLLVVFFTGIGVISRSLSQAALAVISGLAISGILVSVYTHIPDAPKLPVVVLPLICGGCISLMSLTLRGLKTSVSIRTRITELATLGISFILIHRWPMRSATEYLSFISYEDNAAWTQTAAGFREGNYKSGFGGFVLDPLMGTLHGLLKLGSQTSAARPSTAFIITGTTFAVIEFFAILCAGLIVVRLSRLNKQTSYLPLALAPLSAALAYSALQIPQSTGHLTFIGALLFIWSLGLAGTAPVIHRSQDSKKIFLASSLLLLGMTGMWWPLVLILPVSLFLSLQLTSPTRNIAKSLFQREGTRGKVFLAALAALILATPISIPIINALTSMSVRDFFLVKGGLHLASSSLLVSSSLSLLILMILLESKESPRHFPNNPSHVFTSTIALTGVLAAVLYAVSLFIGPEFSQNYSVQKVMLLFALAGTPILMATVNNAAERIGRPNISLVAIPLAFFLGTLTVGWNLNSPRVLTPPAWGANLVRVADENLGAIIFCSTSDPARNLEAYICSRHASALQPLDGTLTADWQHVQFFPARTLIADDFRIQRMKYEMSQLISQNYKVIILSLEENFNIAEEDSWWMNQLPLSEVTKIGSIS